MGKASKTKQEFGRREKIAAQRAAAKRADQRRTSMLIVGGVIVAVIAVVVAFVVVKVNQKSPSSTASSSGEPTGAALASIVSKITSVPTSVTDAVGTGGSAVTGPQAISGGTLLTVDGKPDMLYVGAEYCPYCAAERWSMIVALSRFGTFTGLTTVHSSSTDVYANTPTWTFHGSTYTSKYVSFSPVEEYTNIADASTGGYTTLETPTTAQQALFSKYDAPPYVPSTSDSGSYPFVDFGNKYVIIGSSYSPQVLSGLTWAKIADDMTNTSSPVTQAIGGTANYITAALCSLTGNTPATACTATVQSLESKL